MAKRIKKTGWYDERGICLKQIPDKVLNAFYDDLDRLVGQYFKQDQDADMPVHVKVVDRTRYQTSAYFNLAHTHKLEGPERLRAIIDNLRSASANVSMASIELRNAEFDAVEQLRKITPSSFKNKSLTPPKY